MRRGAGRGIRLELDPEVIVARVQGRQGWLREARRQLDTAVSRNRGRFRGRARTAAGGRAEAPEDLAVEREANEAYEAWRARGVAQDGTRRLAPGTPKPYVPPAEPAGKVNTTDPDSKNLKAFRGYVQGYNAQAVVTEQQIVIAAEVNTDPQDFGHLGPMVTAARPSSNGPVSMSRWVWWWPTPATGIYQQMDELAAEGIPVLIPPDSSKRKTPRPGWDGGRYAWMRRLLASEPGRELYSKRHQTIEPVFGQIKFNRKIDRFQRRGRTAVRSEWRLAAMTHNLLKLHQHRIAATGA